MELNHGNIILSSEYSGNIMGISWENHGKIMGISWEYHGIDPFSFASSLVIFIDQLAGNTWPFSSGDQEIYRA